MPRLISVVQSAVGAYQAFVHGLNRLRDPGLFGLVPTNKAVKSFFIQLSFAFRSEVLLELGQHLSGAGNAKMPTPAMNRPYHENFSAA